jgi:hypothetical protein
MAGLAILIGRANAGRLLDAVIGPKPLRLNGYNP